MKATYIAVVAIFILDYINCEEARVRSVLKPVEGNEVASESNSKVLKSFRFVDMIPTDRVHGRKKDSTTPKVITKSGKGIGVQPLEAVVVVVEEEEEEEVVEEEEEEVEEEKEGENERVKNVDDRSVDISVVSKKSYINDFLISSSKDKKSSDKSNDPLFAASYIDPSSPAGKLNTKITSYGDKISNQNNLRPYTQHLVKENKEHDSRYDDINYKKYGPNSKSYFANKASDASILDVNRFIEYLKHQGFTDEELVFLYKDDLNYGLEEIEKELLKIERERSTKPPAIIEIGGEEGISNKGGIKRPTFMAYQVLLILLFFTSL